MGYLTPGVGSLPPFSNFQRPYCPGQGHYQDNRTGQGDLIGLERAVAVDIEKDGRNYAQCHPARFDDLPAENAQTRFSNPVLFQISISYPLSATR